MPHPVELEVDSLPPESQGLMDKLINSSQNFIVQTSSAEASRLTRLTVAFTDLKRTENPPNPHNPAELYKNLRYRATHGGTPRHWSSVVALDCNDLMKEESEKSLSERVLIETVEKFSAISPRDNPTIQPREYDTPISITSEYLAKLKLKTKVMKQTLIVQNFDALPEEEQIRISELLLRHLAHRSQVNIVLFHEKPITTGKYIGEKENRHWIGLEPDGGFAFHETLEPGT